ARRDLLKSSENVGAAGEPRRRRWRTSPGPLANLAGGRWRTPLGPLANLAGAAAAPPADYPGGAVASDGRSSVTADAGAVPGAAGVLADARPVAWSCSGESSTLSAKWQATSCPDAITRSSGSIVT